ncbi:MAG: hypothetical protein SXV54_15850 [Chloroflexota bacterium]|nr:hypothetical protein [Chloroflexota bacterium]
MSKKRLFLLSGVALAALLLVGLAGATVVSAQEPTPEPQVPFGWSGRDRGMGGFGGRGRMGGFGWASGGQWTMFDTAAEALGLTPDEFFAELHAGKSLDEIAEEQGVEVEAIQDAMNAARGEAMQQAIEQAVEDGSMSQEQADWLLEGRDKGFLPMGRGFGFGRGLGRGCAIESE